MNDPIDTFLVEFGALRRAKPGQLVTIDLPVSTTRAVAGLVQHDGKGVLVELRDAGDAVQVRGLAEQRQVLNQARANGGNVAVTLDRERLFWMLAADDIMRRIDEAQKNEQRQHARLEAEAAERQPALIPIEGDQAHSNPYRAEDAEPAGRRGRRRASRGR